MEKKHTLHKCMMYSEGEAGQKKKKGAQGTVYIYSKSKWANYELE